MVVAGILCVLSGGVAAKDLTVLTAEWPPYVIEEDGKTSGIATEIVQVMLEKAGIETQIEVYPFARAYKMASENPNKMLYPVIRMPLREPLFKWVGPIFRIKSVLHKLKKRTDIVLNSLDDAKKYRINTTRKAAGHEFLLKHGFEDQKNLEAVNSNELSVKRLFAGRVDLEASVDLNFMYVAKQLGFSYSDVEQALVLFESEVCVVFSHSTHDETVNRVREAFEQSKADGTVDAVIEKYLKMYQYQEKCD